MVYRIIITFFFFSKFSFSQVNPVNIDIVRGEYGTPHIFAKTDKEAAYGLAWAHAEDDFKTIQQTFLPVKGYLGKYLGKDGAMLDYVIQLLRCEQTVEAHYKDLSPEVIKVIQGYVEGLNAYALKYPEEVLVKNTFPISVKKKIAIAVKRNKIKRRLRQIFNDGIKQNLIKLEKSVLVIAHATMLNNEYKIIKETLFKDFEKIK